MDQMREELHAAMRARKVADLRYREIVIEAKEAGWSNSDIARAVGVSEAAIRNYLVRIQRAQVRHLITSA
jgi:DNA-binding NarL/FixJ family response regulator